MTTLHPVVLKCPLCETQMSDFKMMSYTVHDAVLWSDGKNDAGNPEEREIKICAVCHLPFWKTEATLPDDPGWDLADELGGALEIRDLREPFDDGWQEFKIDFYASLIREDFAGNDDQEIYLRTQLWWAINDLIRYKNSFLSLRSLRLMFRRADLFKKQRQEQKKRLKLFAGHAGLLKENLDSLIFLLIKKGDVDLIYLAEMYREQGNYRKAREILRKFEGKKGKAYHIISRKVRYKNREVARLD